MTVADATHLGRADHLKYAEDLTIGHDFSLGSHTVTEAELVDFATRWDRQWFHIDKQAAGHGPFGGLIASGLHTLAILQRLTVESAGRHWATIAGRGIRDVRFRSPVRPGDVLTGNVVISDIVFDNRGRALVTTDCRVVNGEGQVVLTVLIDAYLHARRFQSSTT
ncbi:MULTISPECIES: MaoC/PaaZ C-terminal domain-containing protein [Rhodococcus]|uniref:MaoC/PaaZ C-terminal domain-containing protein n=1 Tax=Rhodococcus TaxID=1827 RepID=UPI00101F2FC5|nr:MULTISPECIES: MaoC/PaaZ C-terminal domain-containing protein [Rhodococcus]UTT51106.1 dehydratase [Rhodococcus gordoniae]